MQPNAPSNPTPNPYDFITNPGKAPKTPLFGGNSLGKKVVLIVGGAIAFMIIAGVALTLFGNGNQSNTAGLKSLVAEQQELARVAGIGAKKAQSGTLRGKAATTELSVVSQQQALKRYLEGQNIELSEEELAARKDASTDEALDSAVSSNRFDEVFDSTLSELLATYANNVENAYNGAGNENLKSVLNDAFKSTAALNGSSPE